MWDYLDPVELKKKSNKKLADLSISEVPHFFHFPSEVSEDSGKNLMDKNCQYGGHHRKVNDCWHLSDFFNGSDTVTSLSFTIGTPQEISVSKLRHY